MERALVFRPDPDLVAEVAREGEAADERRDRTDIHPPEGEEGKGRDRNVVGRDLLKEGPGVRPGDREADVGGDEGPHGDAALRRQVMLEQRTEDRRAGEEWVSTGGPRRPPHT